MNELLQKHGCANVFTVPEGLKELMGDISREVLRDQPFNIFEYIANYLSVLLITREHGILAVKILDDLCDCQPSVSEHLLQVGVNEAQVEMLSQIIKEEIEGFEPDEGKAKLKETQILKKILTRSPLDEDMSAKVCQVARNAYRDYWYRKKLLEKNLNVHPEEPWEIAAEHTLELYKRTRPSFTELNRATQKIQAAYKGYHVRRNILQHLKPNQKKTGPRVELSGPPIDISESREIELGPVIRIKVREDDVTVMFADQVGQQLGLPYDPMRTITHVEDIEAIEKLQAPPRSASPSARSQESRVSAKSANSAQSTHSDVQEKKLSETDSQEGPRQSRIATIMAPEPNQTQHSQVASINASLLKISFAAIPTEVIDSEDLVEADLEVPEEMVPADDAPGEDASEIPEDISGERTDGDGESVPSASAPSSAAATDVEDAGEITDAE